MNLKKSKNKVEQYNPPRKSKLDEKKDKKDFSEKNKHKKGKRKKKKNRSMKYKRKNALSKQLSSQSELSIKQLKASNLIDKNKNNNKPKTNNYVPVIYKQKSKVINSNLFSDQKWISSNDKIEEVDEIDIKIKLKKNNKTTLKEKRNIKNGNIEEESENKTTIKLSQRDEDLQDMDFQEAVIEDKRSYLRMYWCFLVDSQNILGTFFTENYLDLLIIKLSFLIFTFQISFFLNALFYTDEYISDAYHNDGILDFFTGLPKAIYSFIAALITTNLLKMLSTSKSELMQIIREKKKEKNYIELINNKLKKLKIKLIIYFILLFSFGLFFFYYVAAFCAVYRYSQKYWFIGCLESFAIDLIVAIILCVILATFRYLAIKKNIKCLYVLGNFINTFL